METEFAFDDFESWKLISAIIRSIWFRFGICMFKEEMCI